MAPDLTPRDKAQAGLWMIRQAVLQLLKEQGEKQPFEIRDALGLAAADNPPPGVTFSVLTLMVHLGELERGEGSHPKYSVKQPATQS